jgi:hypothetical protein
MNLFCPFYGEEQWQLSPQNAANNTNGIGRVARTDVYTLDKHGGLLAIHEELTRKIVGELHAFDNVYYEICNEPYFGGVTMEWQHHIADVIGEAERNLPARHLISMNIANGSQRVENPHEAISIFNFHYASPPDAVPQNYDLGAAIGDNETGFKGTDDTHYRMEAWEFLLAGGALYSNLDYSFAVGFEDGTFQYPETQPGGGTRSLRQQLGALKRFLESFDFLRMKPHQEAVAGLPEGVRARVLAEPGRQYAIYIFGGVRASLTLKDLPQGRYEVTWLHTIDGATAETEELAHPGGEATFNTPAYTTDIALRIVAAK